MFGSLVAQTLKLGQIVEIVKGKQVNGTELLEQGDYYVMNGGTTPSGWLNKYNTEAELFINGTSYGRKRKSPATAAIPVL